MSRLSTRLNRLEQQTTPPECAECGDGRLLAIVHLRDGDAQPAASICSTCGRERPQLQFILDSGGPPGGGASDPADNRSNHD